MKKTAISLTKNRQGKMIGFNLLCYLPIAGVFMPGYVKSTFTGDKQGFFYWLEYQVLSYIISAFTIILF